MGLSLLSQPAQAINWNFSYTNDNGNSFTGSLISDGSSFVANTIYNLTGISGTVTNRGSSALVSEISTIFGNVDNKFVWDGGTGIALTGNGILFRDVNSDFYTVNSLNGGSDTTLSDFSTTALYVQTTLSADGGITSSSLTPTAVPWETDALPVIGSTILFAGGLWARNKFAKPLQK